MAKLTTVAPRIELSPAERVSLTNLLDRVAHDWAATRANVVRKRAALSHALAEAQCAALARCGVELDQAFGPIAEDRQRHLEEMFKQRQNPAVRNSQPALRSNQAVIGSQSGTDGSPFDFDYTNHWESGSALSAPVAERTPQANIALNQVTGKGPQIEATSIAGVGFWYLPPRQGHLWIGAGGSPSNIFAEANGISSRGGTASGAAVAWAGIAQVDPTAVAAPQWLYIAQSAPILPFDIHDNNAYWDQLTGNFTMFAAANVDPQYWYACWAWLTGQVLTINNAGAQLDINVTFDHFNYSFT